MVKVNPWVYATVAACAIGGVVVTAVFASGALPVVVGAVGTVLMSVLSAARGEPLQAPVPKDEEKKP